MVAPNGNKGTFLVKDYKNLYLPDFQWGFNFYLLEFPESGHRYYSLTINCSTFKLVKGDLRILSFKLY